jgi:hypothetical protein
VSHAAGFQQRLLLPQFKNIRAVRSLAGKSAIQDGVSQFRPPDIKQSAEKIVV